VREVAEELGLAVAIRRHVADVWFRGDWQHYFQAEITGGHFGTGRGREMLGPGPPERGTYTPVWLPLAAVTARPVYPAAIAGLLLTAEREGWPAAPLTFVEDDPG
jgi:hypothetical protein